MSREAIFNFIPENLLSGSSRVNNKDTWYASVNSKYGMITISKSYITHKNLTGRLIKFYSDPAKNVIAWRIFKTGSLDDVKGYRHIKQHKDGSAKFSISAVIRSLKFKKESYTGVTIKNYKTTHSNIEGVVEYDYIKIED